MSKFVGDVDEINAILKALRQPREIVDKTKAMSPVTGEETDMEKNDPVEALLKAKLEEVDNPTWYLDLLGTALEETGSINSAVVVADAMYEEQPYPEMTDEEKAWQLVADRTALDDYGSGSGRFDLMKVIGVKPELDKAVRAPRVKPSPFGKAIQWEAPVFYFSPSEGWRWNQLRHPADPTKAPPGGWDSGQGRTYSFFADAQQWKGVDTVSGGFRRLVKDRGQPCKRGEAASRTGCIPKSGETSERPKAKKDKSQYPDSLPVLDMDKEPLKLLQEGDEMLLANLGQAIENDEMARYWNEMGLIGWGQAKLDKDKLFALFGEEGVQSLLDKEWISEISYRGNPWYVLTAKSKNAQGVKSHDLSEIRMPKTKTDVKKLIDFLLLVEGLDEDLGNKITIQLGFSDGIYRTEGSAEIGKQLNEMLYRHYNPVPVWDRVKKSKAIQDKLKRLTEYAEVESALAGERGLIIKERRDVSSDMVKHFDEVRKISSLLHSDHDIDKESTQIHLNEIKKHIERKKGRLYELMGLEADIRKKQSADLHKFVFHVDKPSPISVANFQPEHSENEKGAVNIAADWLKGKVAVGPNGETIPPYTVIHNDSGQFGRGGPSAYYQPKDHAINVHSGMKSIATNVHEMGHGIEYKLPGVQSAAQRFLQHRVKDEPLQGLKEVLPQNGYAVWEKGRKDDFGKAVGEDRAWYVGKHYDDGATEVISMGLEQLYDDKEGFAAKDPEYCGFILGMLDGSIRDVEIPE